MQPGDIVRFKVQQTEDTIIIPLGSYAQVLEVVHEKVLVNILLTNAIVWATSSDIEKVL
jgi:hypothetical protein